MPRALYADMTILPFWQGDSQILEVSQDFSCSLLFLSYFNITPDFYKKVVFFPIFTKLRGVIDPKEARNLAPTTLQPS